jgi:ubiquinone/menaquinone biosynthesis C-methylase UbiE
MIRFEFYQNQILKFLHKNKSILLLGASSEEANLFHKLHYKKITLSNIDLAQLKGIEKYKFKKIKIDFRNLYKIKNNSYDFVVVHASIHHTSRPHNIILEMYRIAKYGILIIESNDSFIMRLSVALNFSENFEVSALNKNTFVGGVDGSNIPNYVYRWTEREIKKLFYSYQPDKKINIFFNYQNNIFNKNLSNDLVKKIIISFSYIFLKIIFLIFPKQQNLMSIYIDKKNYKKRIN